MPWRWRASRVRISRANCPWLGPGKVPCLSSGAHLNEVAFRSMSSDAGTGLTSSRFTENGLRVADDVLGLIEKTPLVRLARVSPAGGATVWGKVEFVNP